MQFSENRIVTRSQTGSLPKAREGTWFRSPFTRRMILNTVENRRKLAIRALKEARSGKIPPISNATIREWLRPSNGRVYNVDTGYMRKITEKLTNRLEEYINRSFEILNTFSNAMLTIKRALYARTINNYITQHETTSFSLGIRQEVNLELPALNTRLYGSPTDMHISSQNDYRLFYDEFLQKRLFALIKARLQTGPVKVSAKCSYQMEESTEGQDQNEK